MSQVQDRPDLFVVVRLLDVLSRNPGGLKKTPLQLAAGVNYTVFSRYLDRLVQRGLVKVSVDDQSAEWISLTPRGAESLGFLVRGISRVVKPVDEVWGGPPE